MINNKLLTKISAKTSQRMNFNFINILDNILKLVAKIFMLLKFALCNDWLQSFFNYLLLIMFDNGLTIEKSNLNFTLNEIYIIIYCYFLILYVI